MARSVFEEVGGDKRSQASGPVPGAADAQKARNRKRVAFWLLAVAALVVAQILLGGYTRLSESGLSITDWRPVTGVLPPMSDAAWEAELEKYRGTTEYQETNRGMTIEAFKAIYWPEYWHRMLGRLIGLVYLGGLAFFAATKAIPPGWTGRLVALGALGALQGVIGWWMVSSGLVGRLDVSQHRLALHLSLAFVILGLTLWFALSLLRAEVDMLQARRRRETPLREIALGLLGLLFAQIVLGAYVAGLDGWTVYAEWPTMGGAFYPPGEPFAPFEEPAAAQFVHRLVAYALLLDAAVFWWLARRSSFAKSRLWATLTFGLIAAQAVVGIGLLSHAAQGSTWVVHQLGGVLVFAVAIHMAHQFSFPKEEKIA
ncbi:MAG: COX15/CtaA family protein [Pseudomonadota bacterium]